MNQCESCRTSDVSIHRYVWNMNHDHVWKKPQLRTGKGRSKAKPVLSRQQGMLCEKCAMVLGAWQVIGQSQVQETDPLFDGINRIIDSRTN